MGPEPAVDDDAACCSCCCRRCDPPAAGRRSVKRKLGSVEEEDEKEGAAGCVDSPLLEGFAARMEAENEVSALREALARQEQTVAALCAELEEERAASESAASEAMALIVRLQREKGEAQMEARQFRRLAEEKMAHDQGELLALEDLLFEREQVIQALSCEVRAYRHRLASYGVALDSLEPTADAVALEDGGSSDPASPICDHLNHENPQLGCCDSAYQLDQNIEGGGDETYLEKCPSGEMPSTGEHRQHPVIEIDKGVDVGQSPQLHLSSDSFRSLPAEEPTCSGKQQEEFHSLDCVGDYDNTIDRVYTVDAVHRVAGPVREVEEDASTGESVCSVDDGYRGTEIDLKKLATRIQALEADRESMRRVIISMQSDKVQLELLKGVARHLCRDVSSPPAPSPEGKLLKKPSLLWIFSFVSMIKSIVETSFLGRISFMSMVKWIMSYISWKKKTDRSNNDCRSVFGLAKNNVGLLLLLETAPRIRQLRFHSRERG